MDNDLEHIFGANFEPSKGEEEWHEQRLGKLTSSRFSDMMQTGRGKDQMFGTMATNYIYEKIAERLNKAPHIVTSQSMDWGTEMELEAIKEYENEKDVQVEQVGFVELEGFEDWAGGTPDGLVGEDGLIEIKCPFNPANHVAVIIENQIPQKYYPQVQGNLMVTGRKWCDFITYDPRVTEHALRMHVIRVERDEYFIQKIKERIKIVSEKVTELLNKLKEDGKIT